MSGIHDLAGIEYHGVAGSTKDCFDAIARLIQFGPPIKRARILTHSNHHCFLLDTELGDLVAIKSGFSSGYAGTGPGALSASLSLLYAVRVELEEYDVDEPLFQRVEQSALRRSDPDWLETQQPLRPSRWPDYVREGDFEDRAHLRAKWCDPVIPMAIVDSRLVELALTFWSDPDNSLFTGYLRLEDIVRKRIKSNCNGKKAFRGGLPGRQP